MLVESLRTLVLVPSRFDIYIYVRLRDPTDGFDFISTHVDDFKVVAKDPYIWIEYISSIFLIKERDPQQYHLGNDCRDHGDQNMWTYGISTYAKVLMLSFRSCSLRFLDMSKMTLHQVLAIDSRPKQFKRSSPDFSKLIVNFLKDYPDAKEELDPGFPSL